MRLVYSRSAGCIEFKVFFDRSFNEYRTRQYWRGQVMESRDYYTSDKQDAIDTANREAEEHGRKMHASNQH